MTMEWIEIFKNFAGPISTIFASIVAASVAATFSYRQWKAAQLQAQIAQQKFNFETFNARHDVLIACREAVAFVESSSLEHKIPRADLDKILSRIFKGKYFFRKTIYNLLDVFMDSLEDYRKQHNAAIEQKKSDEFPTKLVMPSISVLDSQLKTLDLALEDDLHSIFLHKDLRSEADKIAARSIIEYMSSIGRIREGGARTARPDEGREEQRAQISN